jgi:hypothetical protein
LLFWQRVHDGQLRLRVIQALLWSLNQPKMAL